MPPDPPARDAAVFAAVDDTLTQAGHRPGSPLAYGITSAVLAALGDPVDDRLAVDIDVLGLPIRTVNNLRRAGVHTLAQLHAYPVLPPRPGEPVAGDIEPLIALRNLSPGAVLQLIEALREARAPHPQDGRARSCLTAAPEGRRSLDPR